MEAGRGREKRGERRRSDRLLLSSNGDLKQPRWGLVVWCGVERGGKEMEEVARSTAMRGEEQSLSFLVGVLQW